MSTIAVAAALALAAQCAPAADSRILIGIGQQESGLDTLAMHVNGMPSSWQQPHPRTAADATHIAKQFVSAGYSVDLGLMQINSRTLPTLDLSIPDAFDACRSLFAAAKLLSMFAMYNTGSPVKGIANGYASSVAARIHALRDASKADDPVAVGAACPEPDPTEWHAMSRPPGCQPTGNFSWHITPHERDASR